MFWYWSTWWWWNPLHMDEPIIKEIGCLIRCYFYVPLKPVGIGGLTLNTTEVSHFSIGLDADFMFVVGVGGANTNGSSNNVLTYQISTCITKYETSEVVCKYRFAGENTFDTSPKPSLVIYRKYLWAYKPDDSAAASLL